MELGTGEPSITSLRERPNAARRNLLDALAKCARTRVALGDNDYFDNNFRCAPERASNSTGIRSATLSAHVVAAIGRCGRKAVSRARRLPWRRLPVSEHEPANLCIHQSKAVCVGFVFATRLRVGAMLCRMCPAHPSPELRQAQPYAGQPVEDLPVFPCVTAPTYIVVKALREPSVRVRNIYTLVQDFARALLTDALSAATPLLREVLHSRVALPDPRRPACLQTRWIVHAAC